MYVTVDIDILFNFLSIKQKAKGILVWNNIFFFFWYVYFFVFTCWLIHKFSVNYKMVDFIVLYQSTVLIA